MGRAGWREQFRIVKRRPKQECRPFPEYERTMDERAKQKYEEPLKRIADRDDELLRAKKQPLDKRGERQIEIGFLHTGHDTTIGTTMETAKGVHEALSRISKKHVRIHNIGPGAETIAVMKDKKHIAVTYEPYKIANELKACGKVGHIYSYSLNPVEIRKIKNPIRGSDADILVSSVEGYSIENIKRARDHAMPPESNRYIDFKQLDLMTETPSKQADVTTLMGVPAAGDSLHRSKPRDMVLLKNAVDSTFKNGFIVTRMDSADENEICNQYGLTKVARNVYQKL